MVNKQIRINFRNSSLNVNDSKYYDLDSNLLVDDNNQGVDDYSPFLNLTIYNDGSTDLKLFTNSRKGYDLIPAHTIFKIQNDKINFVKVENTSLSSAGSYFLTFDNQETELSLLQKIKSVVI